MKKKNGFTLVELLAVIVVLAIIMVIAIPSVLGSMAKAQESSFLLFLNKAYDKTVEVNLEGSAFGTVPTGPLTMVIYDIAEDLDMSNVGSFQGYFAAETDDKGVINYWAMMWNDKGFVLTNITNYGMPTLKSVYPDDDGEGNYVYSLFKINGGDRVYKTRKQADDLGKEFGVNFSTDKVAIRDAIAQYYGQFYDQVTDAHGNSLK